MSANCEQKFGDINFLVLVFFLKKKKKLCFFFRMEYVRLAPNITVPREWLEGSDPRTTMGTLESCSIMIHFYELGFIEDIICDDPDCPHLRMTLCIKGFNAKIKKLGNGDYLFEKSDI